MEEFNDIKNMVLSTLDTNGALSNIRAAIRHSVFKIIDNQESTSGKSPFFTENQKIQKLAQSKEGREQLLLIKELLNFYSMDKSSDILSSECNIKEGANRESLTQQLGLKGKIDPSKPKYKEITKGIAPSPASAATTSKMAMKPQIARLKEPILTAAQRRKLQQQQQKLQQMHIDKNPSWKMSGLGESDQFGESRGQDQSVDSLKLQDYDYYESLQDD